MNPELFLYTEIGAYGIGAEDFIAQLKAYSGQRVTLRINSPGGSVFEGAAIYNAVKRHPGGVDVVIDGLAASMASVIACGGTSVAMASNALFMIHNPASDMWGDAEDMRREADLLDKVKETIVNSYRDRTGMDAEEISSMMDAETWLTAEQALEFGFIDSITEPLKAAAKHDLSRFKNRAAIDNPKNVMTSESENITPEPAPEIVAETVADTVEATVEPPATETVETVEDVVEAVVETVEAPAEIPAAIEESAPEPSEVDAIVNRISAERAELESLRNEARNLREELVALKSNEANLKNEVAQSRDLYNKLKASLGLAAAEIVPVIAAGNDLPGDILAQFESLSGPAANAFYKANKDAIRKAQKSRGR